MKSLKIFMIVSNIIFFGIRMILTGFDLMAEGLHPLAVVGVFLRLVIYIVVLLYLSRISMPLWMKIIFSLVCIYFTLNFVLDLFVVGRVFLPLIVYIVVLLYLFRVSMPLWVEIIFSLVCIYFALIYVIDFGRAVSLVVRLSSNPHWPIPLYWYSSPWASVKPHRVKFDMFYLGFTSALFILNSLVITDVIKIHKKDDAEESSPWEINRDSARR